MNDGSFRDVEVTCFNVWKSSVDLDQTSIYNAAANSGSGLGTLAGLAVNA